MAIKPNPPYGQLWECTGCGLTAEWHPIEEGGYYAHCSCSQRGAQLRFCGYETGYGPDAVQTATQKEPEHDGRGLA